MVALGRRGCVALIILDCSTMGVGQRDALATLYPRHPQYVGSIAGPDAYAGRNVFAPAEFRILFVWFVVRLYTD